MKGRTFKIFVLALALLLIALFSAKAETTIMQMRNGDRYKVEVNTIMQNRWTPEQYMKWINTNKEFQLYEETSLSEVEIVILFRLLYSHQITKWFDCTFTYEALQYPFDNSDKIMVIGNVQDERNANVFAWRQR